MLRWLRSCRPRVDELYVVVVEVSDVVRCYRHGTGVGDRSDLAVGRRDRTPGGTTLGGNIRLCVHGIAIERQDAVSEIVGQHRLDV